MEEAERDALRCLQKTALGPAARRAGAAAPRPAGVPIVRTRGTVSIARRRARRAACCALGAGRLRDLARDHAAPPLYNQVTLQPRPGHGAASKDRVQTYCRNRKKQRVATQLYK